MNLCGDLPEGQLRDLFESWSVGLEVVQAGSPIPGSHWGAPEAGIRRGTLYVRPDTPVHSALHEGAHLLCMDAERRLCVETDARGDDLEESAVCYLQILLAGELSVGSEALMLDMDAWGYSFRLGSTRRWFEEDAEDALAWLEGHGLLRRGRLTRQARA